MTRSRENFAESGFSGYGIRHDYGLIYRLAGLIPVSISKRRFHVFAIAKVRKYEEQVGFSREDRLKKSGRYDVSKLPEAQFEPGSRGRVLRNLLGIKHKREMDQFEAREQLRSLEALVRIYDESHRFTAADVSKIRKIWLGPIYPWAGQYRQVNISKGDFLFAAARQIPRLMTDLEKGPLRNFTPCRFDSFNEVAHALAVVHTELMLIHPFREGNGRMGRLLAILMALQAKLPPLDFTGIKGRRRQEYFAAVRSGLDRNYEPMEKVFSAVIRRTLRPRGQQK